MSFSNPANPLKKTALNGIPTKYLTAEEFAALTEEEKIADVLYIVDEAPWVPTTISIQEYDTDNWHVRKYSDGYVEFDGTFHYTVLHTNWVAWGDMYAIPVSTTPTYTYPITLTQFYDESLDVTWPEGSVLVMHGSKPTIMSTKRFGLGAAVVIAEDKAIKLHYHVTGRWK